MALPSPRREPHRQGCLQEAVAHARLKAPTWCLILRGDGSPGVRRRMAGLYVAIQRGRLIRGVRVASRRTRGNAVLERLRILLWARNKDRRPPPSRISPLFRPED